MCNIDRTTSTTRLQRQGTTSTVAMMAPKFGQGGRLVAMKALNKFSHVGRSVPMNAPNKFGQYERSEAMKDYAS